MWPHLCWIRFRYSLAVGVLPEWCLGDPHLFAHFLICGKLVSPNFPFKHYGEYDKLYLFHFLAFWLLLELNDCDRVGLAGPLGETHTPHL